MRGRGGRVWVSIWTRGSVGEDISQGGTQNVVKCVEVCLVLNWTQSRKEGRKKRCQMCECCQMSWFWLVPNWWICEVVWKGGTQCWVSAVSATTGDALKMLLNFFLLPIQPIKIHFMIMMIVVLMYGSHLKDVEYLPWKARNDCMVVERTVQNSDVNISMADDSHQLLKIIFIFCQLWRSSSISWYPSIYVLVSREQMNLV